MNLKRGDIILTRFPHHSGGRGKKRPVVVVQSDAYNPHLRQAIVAEITGNLANSNDPAFVFIDVATSEGRKTGLKRNSLVNCLALSTMSDDRLTPVIGSLPASLHQQLDACLKKAMQIS